MITIPCAAADFRTITGLAQCFEGRTCERIIDAVRIERFGIGHRVDRNADELVRPEPRAGLVRIGTSRQVHTVGAGVLLEIKI